MLHHRYHCRLERHVYRTTKQTSRRLALGVSALIFLVTSAAISTPAATPKNPSRNRYSILRGTRELSKAPVGLPAGKKYSPGPADWREHVIYHLFPDRFAQSTARAKKRAAETHKLWTPRLRFGEGVTPESLAEHHVQLPDEMIPGKKEWAGGDIRGITERLDYIQGLGPKMALWISPIYLNAPSAYHGYAPLDMASVDPRFGTVRDFKRLVSAAHERGMPVILDVVMNHMGPIFYYEGQNHPLDDRFAALEQGRPENGRKNIGRWFHRPRTKELQRPEMYSRLGNITDWDDPEQRLQGGDLWGYRRLATEKRAVQDLLIRTAQLWIRETDIDGVRIDTTSHLSRSFLRRLASSIRGYTQAMGKEHFLLLGEIYDGDASRFRDYLSPGDIGLDTAFNYPAYFRNKDALHGIGPTRAMEDSLRWVDHELGPERQSHLLRFVDNLDKPRFLGATGPEEQLRMALGHVLLSTGVPQIFYGSEQGFRRGRPKQDAQGNDIDNMDLQRPPMFGHFNPSHPNYRFIQRVNELRAKHPALWRGTEEPVWSDPGGPGIYATQRIADGRMAVVALNTSSDRKVAKPVHVSRDIAPPGTILVDALDPAYRVEVTEDKDHGHAPSVSISLPAYGFRALVPANDPSAPKPAH